MSARSGPDASAEAAYAENAFAESPLAEPTTSPSRPPTVTVVSRPLWRIRIKRELPRHLVGGVALCGLLASARYAIAPPTPIVKRADALPAAARVDRAAEWFAALFARRYLTWNASDPEAHRLALAPFLGADMEAEAGFQPPEAGAQHVLWTQVVQSRAVPDGEELYTVAVQTDTSGLLYLTVGVTRASGGLALGGYPAFVGPPATTVSPPSQHLGEVEDAALTTVVTRALHNYLARAESELSADLAPGARVALPVAPLSLEALQSLDWSPDRHSVLALVHAHDQRGGRYTLAYALYVSAPANRWQISAIQMDPTS